LERNVVVLLASLLLMGFAEELWIGFVPKYLEALGAGALVWTGYQAIKDLLDALYQYPGGVASDRLGRKGALILFTSLAMAGYALYFVGRHWGIILAATLLVSAWGSMSLPTTFALIGDNLQPGRRSVGFSLQSIVKRVPILIAPVLGGWLLLVRGTLQGFRIALGITLGLAAITLAVQGLMHGGSERPAGKTIKPSEGAVIISLRTNGK
jgi:MFS family permease